MAERDVVVEAFSELARDYEQVVDNELNRFWGWSYPDFVERILQLVPDRQGGLILDVATGTAVIPRKYQDKYPGHNRVIGLDITPAMLAAAREKIIGREEYASISLVCATAMQMPFASGSFDVVVCALGTHHMHVPQMLSQMRRILKEDGRLALADVSASPLWQFPGVKMLLRLATHLYFLRTNGLRRAAAEAAAVSNVLTPREWAQLLDEVGFTRVAVSSLHSEHIWAPAPVVIIASKPAHEDEHDHCD